AGVAATRRGDGPAACALMTARGRHTAERIGGPGFCGKHPPPKHSVRPPKIGPIGTRGPLALAVSKGSFVTGMRRQGGRWLVDVLAPAPVPDSLHVKHVPKVLRTRLPTTGPEVSA